ncbi:kelch-like protein 10 [Tubulanus polymorphus]|uniref:kelch-like protein 10 n=1 Tax=Tubulanus polymorphus TaxID=672921 RepID=UPI003DA58EA5
MEKLPNLVKNDVIVTSSQQSSASSASGTPSLFFYTDDDSLEGRFNILNDLRETEKLCDATLQVGDETFPVHRAILASCSPYFRAMFTNGMQETEKRTVQIPGVNADVMKQIIQYAYTCVIDTNPSNVEAIMVAGDKFSVPGIVKLCKEFIMSYLTSQNCFRYLDFAREFNFIELECEILRHIKVNFDEIGLVNPDVLTLHVQEIERILSADDLNVKNEELVFETIIRWIDHDPDDRLKFIGRLMYCVRLGLIPTDYFLENIVNQKYVLNNPELETLLSSAWDLLYELDKTSGKDVNLNNPLVKPRVPNEVLFAIGGWSGGNPITFFESYDTRSDRWYTHAFVEDNTPRAYHGVVALHGLIYIVGGFDGTSYFNSVRCFNPVMKAWKEAAPMYYQRCYVSTATMDGHIYACGGYDGRWRQKTAERYDPMKNQWTLIPPMHIARSDAGSSSLDGKLYIAGGFNGEECMNSAEVYDPRTNQWTSIRPMEKRRSGVCVVGYDGFVYALGGFNGIRRQADGEKYDPVQKSWIPVKNMYTPRSNFAVAVMDKMIFAIGGFNGTTTIPHVECYDGDSDEWYDATDMNINRSALSACVVKNLANVRDFTFHGNNVSGGTDEGSQDERTR